MQTFNWYVNRLRRMGPREVAWRTKHTVRDVLDRALLPLRQKPRPLHALVDAPSIDEWEPGFRVTDLKVGAWNGYDAPPLERAWLARLRDRADRLAAHRLTFFDLQDHDLGDPIDWNRDHAAETPAPMSFAPWIDYRDTRVTGDCKYVWEPSRHHHLVVLGRAYRASSDVRYADALASQLASWMDQCPYGIGMQWRSPLELGIRLINWVWAMDLIRESNRVSGPLLERVIDCVDRHVWEIARKYSRGSSANNHLVGEAAGVFIATSYFRDLYRAPRQRQVSRDLLCHAIAAQTHPDGVNRELSSGYHLFALQFFLLSGLVGRWTANDFPSEYWAHVAKMFEFVTALHEGGGTAAMLGDGDDGYVLDLGENPRSGWEWMSAAAGLFDRPDFAPPHPCCTEPARWLLRRTPLPDAPPVPLRPEGLPLHSRAFPDAGYYLLQAGTEGEGISVLFDCGPLGLPPLAGHGHADALAFTLRAFGCDVLVDPGTYDYFTFPDWRAYFRSTPAHNTAAIDGQDQSLPLGLFLWGHHATARCHTWAPGDHGGVVAGEHDGYVRLPDPLVHRRQIELDGRRRTVTIRDEFLANGPHEVDLYFHFAERCRLTAAEPGCFEVRFPRGVAVVTLDPHLVPHVHTASRTPYAGWISRGYHRMEPGTTLRGHGAIPGAVTLTTHIRLARADAPARPPNDKTTP